MKPCTPSGVPQAHTHSSVSLFGCDELTHTVSASVCTSLFASAFYVVHVSRYGLWCISSGMSGSTVVLGGRLLAMAMAMAIAGRTGNYEVPIGQCASAIEPN